MVVALLGLSAIMRSMGSPPVRRKCTTSEIDRTIATIGLMQG